MGCGEPLQPEAGRISENSGPAGPDQAFVLSRTPPGGAAGRPGPPVDIHIADRWWRFRGDYLHIGESQVRARDADISVKTSFCAA